MLDIKKGAFGPLLYFKNIHPNKPNYMAHRSALDLRRSKSCFEYAVYIPKWVVACQWATTSGSK